MIALLPMYDFPELRAETDAFWQGLSGHFAASGLADVPEVLARPADLYAAWLSPDLMFAQTCGYPLTHRLKGRVRYLATPSYSAEGCAESSYRSFIIVRDEAGLGKASDLAGRVAAFNGADSQSGSNVLKRYLSAQGVPPGSLGGAVESGAHRKSVGMVKSGEADFCAIDCVSWALLGDVAPEEVAGLRILAETEAAPCLPFVTSLSRPIEDVSALRAGLAAAFDDPELAEVREKLQLEAVNVFEESAYDIILTQEAAAQAAGWMRLA